MKKFTAILLSLCLALCPIGAFGTESGKTIVLRVGDSLMTVNGEAKEIDPGRGTAPVIIEGRTLVPVRAIIEELGGEVGWSEASQMISLKLNDLELILTVGKTGAMLRRLERSGWDTQTAETDAAPLVIDGRTMVPARFVMESFGYEVSWDEGAGTVTITRPALVEKVIGKVNGEEIYLSDYNYMCSILETGDEYFGVTDDSQDFNEDMLDFLTAYVVYGQQAASRGIEADAEKVEFYREALADDALAQGMEGAAERMARRLALFWDLKEKLTSEGGECRATLEDIDYNDENYTKARHILISFDGRDENEAKARADEVLERLKKGEDFKALSDEYNEDPGMLYNDWYVFIEEEMVDEFYNGARALGMGEISPEPVRSNFGYHIIQRLPLAEDDIDKSSDVQLFIDAASSEKFDFLMNKLTLEAEVEIF